ncbi:MAG: hypothetical protein V3T81_03815 [Thermoanaerobaculia bacterium]
MSYCAARLHAISGRPRSSRGDTIPSCPQSSWSLAERGEPGATATDAAGTTVVPCCPRAGRRVVA